jgi:hypothetical protein
MRESPGPYVTRFAAIVATGLGLFPAMAAADSPQVIRFHGGAYDRAGSITTDSSQNTYVGGAVDRGDGGSAFAVIKLGPDGAVRWSAHYNGSLGGVLGQVNAVTTDAAGNVYAAGYISDGVIFNQNYDYLVVKFGPDGVQRWAQRYDGPGRNTDFATQVVVDGAGNVYATGFSSGTAYGHDWATLKFAADGSLRWERRLSGGPSSDDRAADMALLPDGNVVVAGVTQNTGDAQTADVETVAYDPQGNIIWRTRWTDTAASHETVADLDVDGAGRIAITGTTAENASPYVPPFPLTLRYDKNGALLQTIRDDGGSSVDVDATGNVYLVGSFVEPAPSSVAKYSAAGGRVWRTPLTAGSGDGISRPFVAADSTGAVTVAATVRATGTGDGDYLTIRYGPDGRELWRHRFGGSADPGQQDFVAGVVVDAADAALVTGTSWNGYLSSGGTADDIVTLKFAAGAAPALVAPSQLSAQAVSRSEVQLRWRDNAGTEDGFRIERCTGTGCTSFSEIAAVGHDETSYLDGGLARRTSYSYRVRTYNSAGSSAYSNTATAKTPHR